MKRKKLVVVIREVEERIKEEKNEEKLKELRRVLGNLKEFLPNNKPQQ